ncbi:MAG: class IV adenylate cyclase [Phycisphaerae bacterium]|nr:class IV adenylate cyclase [Phycisphaerae bacterium]
MAREIEMKFRLPRLTAVARRLRALGAKRLHTVLQDDWYFDTPRRRLLRQGCGLRLRRVSLLRAGVGALAPRAELTYKGPARRRAKAKVRPEHQTHLDDPAGIEAALAACGLRPMLRLQKRRATYRLGGCVVAMDELPVLGCFVEIEGPNQAAIERLRRRLALTGRPIRSHYVKLLQSRCARAGRQCLQAAFSICRRCADRPR